MRDLLHNEINLGDKVIYSRRTTNNNLDFGIVQKIGKKLVVCTSIANGGAPVKRYPSQLVKLG